MSKPKQSAWDKAQELADKHANSGGIFVRLANNGDKVVGAFCGEPYTREMVWVVTRYEDFDPEIHADKKLSLRVMLNFYVPAEKAMKVIEGGTAWFKDVLKVRDKYGLDKWLFEIERHGEAGDTKTTYSILPEEKLDVNTRAMIAALEQHDLATVISGVAASAPPTANGARPASAMMNLAQREELDEAARDGRLPQKAREWIKGMLAKGMTRETADRTLARIADLVAEYSEPEPPPEREPGDYVDEDLPF